MSIELSKLDSIRKETCDEIKKYIGVRKYYESDAASEVIYNLLVTVGKETNWDTASFAIKNVVKGLQQFLLSNPDIGARLIKETYIDGEELGLTLSGLHEFALDIEKIAFDHITLYRCEQYAHDVKEQTMYLQEYKKKNMVRAFEMQHSTS